MPRPAPRGPRRSRATLRLLAPALAAVLAAAACGKNVDARLDEAQKLQQEKQPDAALVIVREVLKDDPENPRANFLLGIGLLQRGEGTSAIFPLRRAVKEEQFAVDAGLLLARTFAATQNLEEAESAATTVLERQPDNTDALGVRAQTRIHLNQFDTAIADIDHMLRITPDDPKLLLAKAGALDSAKRYDDARPVLEQAEKLEREAGDLSAAATACANRGGVLQRGGAEMARILDQLEKCATAYPTQINALRPYGEALTQSGRPEVALEAWRKGATEAPESLELRLGLAEQLLLANQVDAAITEAQAAADEFGSVTAWLTLANLQRRTNRLVEADATLERAEELSTDVEPIRFLRAELLVDRAEYDEAESLAATLTDPAHAAFVRGRILLRRGDPKAALESFDGGLARWPNNAVARAEAGSAAQQIGDFDRAIGHYRESVRVDPKLSQAGLLGATLAYSLGRYDDAITLAGSHVASRAYEGPEPYRIAIRSAHAAGMADVVRNLLNTLVARGEPGVALSEEALIVGEKGGPAAVEKLFSNTKVDLGEPKNESALRSLLDAQISQGKAAEALAVLDRVRSKHDRPALQDLRGRILLQLGKPAEAEQEFAKALASDPEFGPARAGLAGVALAKGDHAKALVEFEAAAAAKTPDPEADFRAAQLIQAKGDSAEAEKRLRTFVARVPDHASASNDLAWILAEHGTDLGFAAELATRASRLRPAPETIDTLAWVQIKQGDTKAAIATLDGALVKWPGNQTLLFRLGLARKAAGDRAGALEALRQAVAGGEFAEAKAAQAELANLETGEKP
jgi:tetratricopeptide (TPR) repeat protein